ncbi:MAG: AMP-binding protein [Elainellaceae cyanobacterium]
MTSITDDFVAHAQRHPQQVAISAGHQTVTYGELLHRVQKVAGAIATVALQEDISEWSRHPGVGVLLPNRLELLEVFLGTAMAGGVVMVLNPDWALPQIQSILERWTPDLLISEGEQLQAIGAGDLGMKAIALDIALDAEQSPDVVPYAAWLSQSNLVESRAIASSDPFYIGFTSGTTGDPKGIIRTHQSWLHSFAASRVEFHSRPHDPVLVPGALVHSLSLYTAIETLVMGASLHILPHFSPKTVLHQLQQAPITRLVAVPTVLRAIATVASRQHITIPHLQTIIVGGSKLSPSLRHRLTITFPRADVMEYYGASELSFVSLASSREPVPPESVGRAFHGVQVSVQQDDGAGEAAVGEIGWIGIQSPMICSGYLDPHPKTGFRIEQGWATVGDRGWMDGQGYLYLVGREHDMLISSGINVYPSEIEAVLLQLPQIETAVVVGLPDDCRGDLICAVIIWSRSAGLTRSDLIRHIQGQLGSAKCPRRFFAVASVPVTSSGKVARAQLQAQILRSGLSNYSNSRWVVSGGAIADRPTAHTQFTSDLGSLYELH